MKITGLSAFTDNYIWCLDCDEGRIIFDPGHAKPVLDFYEKDVKKKTAIFLTHNHQDHTGGVQDLKHWIEDLVVYGPSETKHLNDLCLGGGAQVDLFGLRVDVLGSPGHTIGSLSYLIKDQLFPGDALFKGGCGRVFTGDYQALYDSLSLFKNLADEVKVYPAHEYSLDNLVFAQSLFPDKEAITRELAKARKLRDQGEKTLPTTIGLEKETNPFFLAKDLDQFIEFRKKKDSF